MKYFFAYNTLGNLVTTVNATGMQTDLTYDALNRLLTTTEAGELAATYDYDTNNNTTSVADAANNTTTFTFDDQGRRLTRTAPDTGLTSYAYDEAGNLVTVFDAENRTMTMAYDALNRPVSQSYDGTDTTYTYDQGSNGVGRLSTVDDEVGSRSFEYNNRGQLATEIRTIGGVSYTTDYSYSTTTGELEAMTYPSGRVLTYTRDTTGRITTISLDGSPLFTNGSYLPFGPLKGATLGDQINLSREYDQRYQVSRIQGGGLDYGYTRDASGHVTGISNIQLPEPTGETVDYSYIQGTNQLADTTGSESKSYSYDAVGNMLSDVTHTFTYDDLNRLVQVEEDGIILADYGYDSQYRRVSKTVNSTTIHYHYDASNLLIGETLADGTPIRDYFYINGEPIGVQEYLDAPGVYYFINDHLGTPQRLVDTAGTVVWSAGYLPFGKAQVQVETVVNNLRFPGQYFDQETGLHYNWHRFYDPETGRYITADPIGLQGGMNLYAYVKNNPENWIDPDGLIVEIVDDAPSRPDIDLGDFTLTDTPPKKLIINTVRCGNNGKLETYIKASNDCIDDCVRRHEEIHIQHFNYFAPNLCNGPGRNDRWIIINNDTIWSLSEMAALIDSIQCYKEKLKNDCGECRDKLKNAMNDAWNQMRDTHNQIDN